MAAPALLRFRWLILVSLIAFGLFASLWVAHPRQPAGTFDIMVAHAARWPSFPLFAMAGVPDPTFFDTQNILWACEVDARGGDAYSEPVTVKAPYFYGYPRGWLLLGKLGFDRSDTRWISLTWIALFYVAAIAISGATKPLNALWCIAGLCAPPALEGAGMANNDLILFVMLVLAAWLWQLRLWGGGPALAVLALAAWLKLHPAVTLVALLDGTRRMLVIVVAGTLALAGLFAAQWKDIARVSYITPRPHVHAVGHQVLPARLLDGATRHPGVQAAFDRFGGLAFWNKALPRTTAVVFVVFGVFFAWRGLKSPRAPEEVEPDSLPRILFRIGALVHLAAFAIGQNWMHREIFLLLCGPWLLAEKHRRWLAGFIVAAWWLAGVTTGVFYLVSQLATWVVTGGLAFYFARDIREDLRACLPPALQRWVPAPA
jgi:hypothetical protein